MPVRRGETAPSPTRHQPGWGWRDPISEFENLWGEMNRFFRQGAMPTAERPWVPMVEEEEAEDAYIVRAELPGIPRDNVMVELDANELHITGQLSEEQQGKVLSRRTGRFTYRTIVPNDIDSDRVEAEMADGVLTVRIPKSPRGKRRAIRIGGGGKT
ncbi:Hsp20/alpha crystallin family protein [Streptomyces macrosporus]